MRRQGLKVSLLPQEHPTDVKGSLYQVAAQGLGKLGIFLAEQHGYTADELLTEAERQKIMGDLDENKVWSLHQNITSILTKLKLEPKDRFETLSGGYQRRALLAQTLAAEPDLLMLDEPTNHLDIESITWLENYLAQQAKTLIFITHDRMFLRNLATRIVELDRGRLMDWACDYPTYIKRKEKARENEQARWARQDRKIAEEEAWLSKGLKARRTRNEGRVRALIEMREQRAQRRQRTGSVSMLAQEAERSGKLVATTHDVSFGYEPEKQIIKGLKTIILWGDKVGIMGPNGSGKTTLLRLLLGSLTPDGGSIKRGARIKPAYFDQLRQTLDLEKTVAQNINPDADTIVINGSQKHVISYLKDFLFSAERAQSPVKTLSGGERNRLLLAKLFTQPSNLLILDEPTNDLDTDTLELLESLLVEYQGTVLLVSHDRAFINNVVTSTLVIGPDGVVTEYAGGYDDWLTQNKSKEKENNTTSKKAKLRRVKTTLPKLTWKQERELEELPTLLESLEKEQADLERSMSDPEFYRQDGDKVAKAKTRLEKLEEEMEGLLERWEELEAIQKAALEAKSQRAQS
jgi:ATP-binding cassette subfamily F protein uup